MVKKNYTRIYDKRGDWLGSLISQIFRQILKHLTKRKKNYDRHHCTIGMEITLIYTHQINSLITNIIINCAIINVRTLKVNINERNARKVICVKRVLKKRIWIANYHFNDRCINWLNKMTNNDNRYQLTSQVWENIYMKTEKRAKVFEKPWWH